MENIAQELAQKTSYIVKGAQGAARIYRFRGHWRVVYYRRPGGAIRRQTFDSEEEARAFVARVQK